ncbi:MAG: hemolysin, partial [Betaproteobacteria bacterium]|nr:hemolysin [Betaproteobacteria bacterium]
MANVNDLPSGSMTISGPATQGQTLTATHTLADADGLGAISYQWKSGGSDIGGANTSTLVLTEALVGKAISVLARYTDGHGTAESMMSSATAAVANVNDLPTGAVTINGTAAKGQTLAASNTLADADGLGAISYQWRAAGVAIGTGNTLLLADAQVGKPITVTASYTDGHGAPESITSSASAAVAIANSATASSVTIVGAALQGQTLTATLTLANVDVGLISYQWQAAGIKLSGATSSTLLLTEALVGKTIEVVASYTVLTHPYVEPPAPPPEGPAGAIGDPASLSFLKVKQSVVLATASTAKAAALTGAGGTVEFITSSPTAPVANVNDLP